jgi:hypothetical protein
MPDAAAPPWAQSEKDREKRRLKVWAVSLDGIMRHSSTI